MKTARICLLFVVAMCLLSSRPLLAEGWGLTNPFGKKKSEEKPASTGPSNSFRTSPRNERSSARDEDEPSVFDRMNQSTHNFFAKTKDMLTPDKKPAAAKPKSKTAAQSTGWGSNSAKKSNSKQTEGSGFFSWFKRDEPRPSKTVGDFLGQPRP